MLRFARCLVGLLREAPKSLLLCALGRSPCFLCVKKTFLIDSLIGRGELPRVVSTAESLRFPARPGAMTASTARPECHRSRLRYDLARAGRGKRARIGQPASPGAGRTCGRKPRRVRRKRPEAANTMTVRGVRVAAAGSMPRARAQYGGVMRRRMAYTGQHEYDSPRRSRPSGGIRRAAERAAYHTIVCGRPDA